MPPLGHEIYVAGLGVISAAGDSLDSTVKAMRAGLPGLAPVKRFQTRIDAPAGEVTMSDRQLKDLLEIPDGEVISRTALLGIKAVRDALSDCSMRMRHDPDSRIAFISGTSVGGMDLSEVFWQTNRDSMDEGDAKMLKMHDPGGVTMAIDNYFRSRPENFSLWQNVGFVTTISTACSAAGNAIITGARMIRAGLVDIAIVGGTDALCKFTLNGFNSLHILDRGLCRPFDADRQGLNLGEGAGYLVLARPSGRENADGFVQPYCCLAGWGNANEAYHQTASTPEGIGPALAMETALRCAGISPESIGFINTHGTGTIVNDAAEMNAMMHVFGDSLPPYSSVKPYLGHTLGASEGIEAALCCHALADMDFSCMKSAGWSKPLSDNAPAPYGVLGVPGASFPVYAPFPRIDEGSVMSSAFGFSGNCVSLIFSRC